MSLMLLLMDLFSLSRFSMFLSVLVVPWVSDSDCSRVVKLFSISMNSSVIIRLETLFVTFFGVWGGFIKNVESRFKSRTTNCKSYSTCALVYESNSYHTKVATYRIILGSSFQLQQTDRMLYTSINPRLHYCHYGPHHRQVDRR
jgi:hypothetical protein